MPVTKSHHGAFSANSAKKKTKNGDPYFFLCYPILNGKGYNDREFKKISGADFLKLLKTIIFDWLEIRSRAFFFLILPKVLSRAAILF